MQLISSTGMYGAENVVMELLKEINKEEFETFFGIIENPSKAHMIIAEEAGKYTPHVQVFSCESKLDFKTVFSLRRFLKDQKINLIHSHGYKSNFNSFLASAAKNIALVTTCHNWLSINSKMKLYEWLDKRVLNRFDRTIVVSDEIRGKILKTGVSSSKVIKIKNGINIKKYSTTNKRTGIRAEFNIDEDKIVVGSLGRLDDNKGITNLLKAARLLIDEFENIIFLLVGDGPARDKLCNEVDELGIKDHVVFAGFRDDIPSVLSAIDIFALPSLKEGLPMVLLETMAAKKPLVATRVGDIPGIVKHNESGILIEPGDVKQLQDGLKNIIEDKALSNSLADRAFERVSSEYSSKRMAAEYMKTYDDVLEERHILKDR